MENGQCLGSDGASCALVDVEAPDAINRNPLTSAAPLGFSLEICAELCARSTSCNGFELSGCENKCTFVTCGDSITGNSTAERDTSTQCYMSKAARKSSPRRETSSGPSDVRFASDAGSARTTSRTSSRERRTRTAASLPRGNRPTRFLGVRIAQPSCPRRASRKARDLFRAGNRNCAWAYRQASRCNRVDFQGTRVGDACCQSCKAAKVNDLLSQDLEFVLG